MERLTKRINGYAHGAEGASKEKLTGSYCRGKFEATACVEKLEKYEGLEEQGKLLKPPCAVGDTVYEIDMVRNEISEFQITAVTFSEYGFFIKWNLIDGIYRNLNGFNHEEIGKTVFLSRKEAEAALEGEGE